MRSPTKKVDILIWDKSHIIQAIIANRVQWVGEGGGRFHTPDITVLIKYSNSTSILMPLASESLQRTEMFWLNPWSFQKNIPASLIVTGIHHFVVKGDKEG